jgi:hypothetical protein
MKTSSAFGSTFCSPELLLHFGSSMDFSSSRPASHFGTQHIFDGKKFNPGLDMRALSQRIKNLKLAGRSIEEIAKEIDPKEFEDMWRW